MSLIRGQIDRQRGAAIQMLVGVARAKAKVLLTAGHPVPERVPVFAQIDTGSDVTGFGRHVFEQLGLQPVGKALVHTPSTQDGCPHPTDLYDVSLTLVANANEYRLPDMRVISAGGWRDSDNVRAILGRDVLSRCHLMYFGPERTFSIGIAAPPS